MLSDNQKITRVLLELEIQVFITRDILVLIVLAIKRWPDVHKAITGKIERKPGWVVGTVSLRPFLFYFLLVQYRYRQPNRLRRDSHADVEVKIEQDKHKAKNLGMRN